MQLQARIVIMTRSLNKPFYYTTDYNEIIKIMGFPTNSIGSWDLEIGKTIIIKNEECKVEGFEARIYSEINEPHGYGINLYGEGKDHAYNIDFIILVNEEAAKLRS